ncbi:MAG: CoA-binding protein [Rhizobacter sp.]|nr:CoA-binding protein [Rhizobacter sp.]
METNDDLSRLVNPSSIVLVGASDRLDSIGQRTLANLTLHSSFEGELYLVNPTKAEIAGRRCWPSVSALPATPDVAVVVVPASGVLTVLEECGARGVRFAVILSSGFGEAGEAGRQAEVEMAAIAKRHGLRLYGPNCPGLVNVNRRLGMTFSPSFPHDLTPGPIGLATQGGGLGRNIMQAMERGIGIGLWASTGNEVDLQVADFIAYMADAPDIKVIVTLLEGIKDGPRFVRAVQRAIANGKPVVALKVGKSAYGMKAAQSHTASLTGSAEVNSAVLAQLGVIEVDDIDELVDTGWLLSRALPKRNDAIAIYCSSGGTAALCADALGTAGLTLADFAPDTTAVLKARLPDYAGIGNPVDTTSVVLSDNEVVEATLAAVAADANVGMVLLPIALDYGETTTSMARHIVKCQATSPVPILPIWMSDRQGEGYRMLVAEGFAPPRTVGKTIKAVKRWVEYGRWMRDADRAWQVALPPVLPMADEASKRALSEADGKAWLAKAGIAVLPSGLASSPDDAVRLAAGMGYPVVAKVASAQIVHKSDVGGVAVGLADEQALRAAWARIMASVAEKVPGAAVDGLLIEKMAPAGGMELLVGVTRDPVFGHVMTFGLGGIYVEVFRDVTRRLLPLRAQDAAAMVREMRCYPLLAGARGKPAADVAALEALLMKVSAFVMVNASRIEEMDLNPVWVGATGQGAIPLDAVIVERLTTSGARIVSHE